MKKLTLSLLVVIALFATLLFVANNAYNKLQSKYENAQSLIKAYDAENASLASDIYQYSITVEQLNHFNDSIIQKLNKARKDLKVKDSKIKSLQYQLSQAQASDTIIINDTIFKEPNFRLDTLISHNPWYTLRLQLRYPSTITANPTFISERYAIFQNKRETVDPPKKYWIQRIFQKKHTVVTVDVIEKSPYIKVKDERFIEVIK